jgi:hypothetical protein
MAAGLLFSPGGESFMGILSRITALFHAKVLRLVDGAEDPRDTLAYACERQQELLANVRRALVEVTASKHQIAAQIQRLEQRLPQLEGRLAGRWPPRATTWHVWPWSAASAPPASSRSSAASFPTSGCTRVC